MNRGLLLLLPILLLSSRLGASTVDFESEIQPILAEKCMLCHGPDDKKGGLRLTSIEFASTRLKSGRTAITPGDVEESHLLTRIHSQDPDEIMPPPGKAEPLTDSEKRKLRQWIAEGANWPKHWAYREIAYTAAPNPADESQSPIDYFISQALAEKKIAPSPPADDITLIRRLFYDLMGLPPTPEQIADHLPRFQADRQAGMSRLVSDLLASPHFGERWGRHWLDHARYADSDGYEKDNNRPNAWRYRDWVIDAINRDLPFDQFTIEQFAGDLLENPTPEQRLATAFNRQTLTNTEGGTDKEQWRVAAVMDRVETVGTVWLGLTVGCARCHTHKYDEITQQEYYELFAYFNNGDETNTTIHRSRAALDSWKKAHSTKTEEIEQHKAALSLARQTFSQRLPALVNETARLLASAKKSPNTTTEFIPLSLGKISGPKGLTFQKNKDHSILVGGSNPASGTYLIEAELDPGFYTEIKLEALADSSLPANGPGRVSHGNFVLNHIRIFADGVLQPLGHAEADHSQDGWQVTGALHDDGKVGRNGSGWAVGNQYGKPHYARFGLARPLNLQKRTPIRIELVQNYGSQHMIGKFRIAVRKTASHLLAPPEIHHMLLTQQGIATDLTLLNPEQRTKLSKFHEQFDSEIQSKLSLLTQAQSQMPPRPEMSVRVISERVNERRATHIFRRGEFKQPLDKVEPATLSTLPTVRHRGANGDRLDLARWLVDGKNPLPPRVVVNRIWAHLFGEGIVHTINDFGVRGERPSHPELLDWLAGRYIDLGWSRKTLIREIVMSEAYQRSSVHREDLRDIDPKNRLLARQNRFRVEAEIVRDISLSAAGLLSQKVGGPSVFPPIPPGVTDANYNSAFKWKVSSGEDRYRRGIYTYFKRTAPHPNLMTFDCPDSNVTNVQRMRSNTPLAALITLNNATFTEAAQALARRILGENSESADADKLDRAFQLCLSRAPEDSERNRLQRLLEDARVWYQSNEEEAIKFSGDTPPPTSQAAVETASWAATLRVLLNLDEFLTRG